MSSDSGRVKTCENCVRAKIRCLRTPGASICDRCRRLNKECYFRPTRSRYNPAKNHSRIETLEAKVEQLMAHSGAHLQPPSHASHSPFTPDSEDLASEAHSHDVIDHGIMSLEEADVLFDKFRQNLMPHFPFVIFSPEMTLPRLRAEKPFLLLAILMVSSAKNIDSQKVLERAFQEAIADRMIFNHSPSVDVLQGLLVAQAWLQHQTQWSSNSTFLHLARGIVGDLEFDRLAEPRSARSSHIARGIIGDLECDRLAEPRTTRSRISVREFESQTEGNSLSLLQEKQRAVLGCFALCSCCSTLLQRGHTMSRLPYIDIYARDLAQAPKFPSDGCLIHILRLQHIMERIDEAVAVPVNSQNLLDAHTFFAEIDSYKTKVPFPMADSFIIQLHLYTLELFVCQAYLFDRNSSAPFPLKSTTQQPDAGAPPHLQSSNPDSTLTTSQFELLCRGLTAAKGALDYLLAQDSAIDRRLSYMQWLQSGFSLVLACKLAVTASNYASQSPHLRTLCISLDMPRVLRDMLYRMHRLNGIREEASGKPSTRTFYLQWIGRVQTWFEQRYHSMQLEQPSQIPPVNPSSHGPASSNMSAPVGWNPVSPTDYNQTVSQPGNMGAWPDFVWNFSMDDILNGPMDFMGVPFNYETMM